LIFDGPSNFGGWGSCRAVDGFGARMISLRNRSASSSVKSVL
jgi:hypothetical protein